MYKTSLYLSDDTRCFAGDDSKTNKFSTMAPLEEEGEVLAHKIFISKNIGYKTD